MSLIFPKKMNKLPTVIGLSTLLGLGAVVGIVWYYFTPKYWSVGYMPTQPGGGFNHQIHAGKLGIDCRYCHSNVEKSPEANIPTVATCNGCHAENRLTIFTQSQEHKDKTQFIRDAWDKNDEVLFRRVQKVPDYVRNFPHNVHVNAGVSCLSCHGNIARMPVVYQAEPLSMSWCLDCHRNPKASLVPKKGDPLGDGSGRAAIDSLVTRLFDVEREWKGPGLDNKQPFQQQFYEQRQIAGPESCGACHY